MDTLIGRSPPAHERVSQWVTSSEQVPHDTEDRYRGFVECARKLEAVGDGLPPDSAFARSCYRLSSDCYLAAMELLESDDPRRIDVRVSVRTCLWKAEPPGL